MNVRSGVAVKPPNTAATSAMLRETLHAGGSASGNRVQIAAVVQEELMHATVLDLSNRHVDSEIGLFAQRETAQIQSAVRSVRAMDKLAPMAPFG